MLDLGQAGHAHAHSSRGLLLPEAQVLAGLSELVPAGLSKHSRAPASIYMLLLHPRIRGPLRRVR